MSLDTGSGQYPESHYHKCNSVEVLTEFVSLWNKLQVGQQRRRLKQCPYMRLWSTDSSVPPMNLDIRSVSRKLQSITLVCGGSYWFCKFLKQTERHLWDKKIPRGRWAHLPSSHHVWRWTCCVLWSDRARGRLKLIKSCHITTVHTECFRLYQTCLTTCVNVVQVGF